MRCASDDLAIVENLAAATFRKLRVNRHKASHNDVSREWLLDRCEGELGELRDAVARGSATEILNEAADVANFAAMVADHWETTE